MKNSSLTVNTAKSISDPCVRQRIAAEFVLRMLEKYGKDATDNSQISSYPKRDKQEI